MPSNRPDFVDRHIASSRPPRSDERLDAVRQILAPAGQEYRSALSSATEEARVVLRTLESAGNGRTARVAQELGGFALGPLDPVQFTALLDPEKRVDPGHLKRLEEAVAIMEWDLAEAAPVTAVDVDSKVGLRDTVEEALAERGRSYGAVRTAVLLRGGSYSDARDERLLGRLPFREWRSLERTLAPPLVVTVEGRDLDTVSGLAQFLDGGQKIVLLVSGPCPPAPLARLMGPNTFVVQAMEPEALEGLASFSGSGVAALVPPEAARFVYEPEDGGALDVEELPESPPRMWVGGISPAQQAEDLRILESWGRRQEAPFSAGTNRAGSPAPGDEAFGSSDSGSEASAPTAPDPAERLAAWLLSRADLDDAEG